MDRLVLDEASDVAGDPAHAPASSDRRILVLDAPDLALHLAGRGVRVWHRGLLLADERAVTHPHARVLEDWADPGLADVDLVLLRLPANLGALDEYAWRIARHCHPEVRLVAGARVKHMTHSMNDVLAEHFARVHASRGRQKSRALHATGALAQSRHEASRWPRGTFIDAWDMELRTHGATFAGRKPDRGTRLLVDALQERLAEGPRVDGASAVDLGSGSGILAVLLARAGWRTTAVDTSRAAVAATRATAEANGLGVQVARADVGTDASPAHDHEMVVCNPPFHVGTAKDSSPGFAMIAWAGEALEEGGEFWCVFNAHLPYLGTLKRRIGPTSIVARDRNYIVTRSQRRPDTERTR